MNDTLQRKYGQPWHVQESGGANFFWIMSEDSKHWIAKVQMNGEMLASDQQVLARAMAASPQMFEVLDAVAGMSVNLREGGPAPDDLEDLSYALEEAVDMAAPLVDSIRATSTK